MRKFNSGDKKASETVLDQQPSSAGRSVGQLVHPNLRVRKMKRAAAAILPSLLIITAKSATTTKTYSHICTHMCAI